MYYLLSVRILDRIQYACVSDFIKANGNMHVNITGVIILLFPDQ